MYLFKPRKYTITLSVFNSFSNFMVYSFTLSGVRKQLVLLLCVPSNFKVFIREHNFV